MIPVQNANTLSKRDQLLGSKLLHPSQQSLEPLLLKKSLSVSSLLKFSPEKEALHSGRNQRGFSPQRLLTNTGSSAPLQRGDDFWDSLCTHYNYLMDEGLIDTCREANSELSKQVEGDCDWSFTEFIQKFNELHDVLHSLLEQVTCITHAKDEKATVGVLEKLQSVVLGCKQFKEQSQQLGQRYPDMKDEINRRVNLLNNKWETLEQAINPHKPQPTQEALYNEVTHEMRCLRRWLRDVEDRLLPANDVTGGWTLDNLELKFQGQQVLQKEIESRGQLVSSLLHLCDRLQQESSRYLQQQEESQTCSTSGAGAVDLPPHGGIVVSSRLPWDAERICRVASNLEKRWHALWLRSLEEQCRVEELIRKCKAGLLPSDPSLESSFGEEPPQKYPRLTDVEWSPLPSRRTMSQRGENIEAVDQEQRQNDKAVMVGSTGIAELKAEYGTSPFGRFEIIQDVGYSSESSTHLSGEDNHEFIQVYSYSPATKGKTIVTEYKVCRNEKVEAPPPLETSMDWQLTSEEDDDLFLDNLPPALSSSPKQSSPNQSDGQLDESGTTTLVDRSLSNDLGGFSVRELVSQADQLVREELRKRSPILANPGLAMAKEKFLKSDRVQEWLRTCTNGKSCEHKSVSKEDTCPQQLATSPLSPPEKDIARSIESSCDASGEYTTNDSSDNSGNESRAEETVTHRGRRLSHSGTGSVETVVPLINAGDNPDSLSGCRVVLRSKKRNKRDRPWSVTELYQASNEFCLSPHSTSEGALNVLATNRLVPGSVSLYPCKSPSQDQIVPQHSPLRRHHRRHRSRASLPLHVHCSSLTQTEGQSSGSDQHSSSRHGHSEGGGGRWRQHSSYHTSSDSAQCSSSQCSCRSARCSSNHSGPGLHHKNKKRKPVSSDETTKGVDRLSCKSSARSLVKSAAEVFSSQVEDVSSVSDQAWDSYEDPPYLSEPYSEQTPDAEQIKRLTDFGDDYRAFICSDASSSISGRTASRSARGRSLTNNTQQVCPGGDSETDSDVEELQCLLQESSQALHFARNTLRSQRKTSTGTLDHTESVELLATCQTHLKCLQVISQHLDPSYHLLSTSCHDNLLDEILNGWEMLQVEVLSSQENGEQFQEVQKDLVELRKKIDSLAQTVIETGHTYSSMEGIQNRISTLQNSLSVLHETKTWLLAVNLKVHRFLTENGLTCSTMKDNITQLYALWDDIYERCGSQLTELQDAYNKWQHFNEDWQKLEGILAQEELEQVSLGKEDYWQKAEKNQTLCMAAELLVSLEKGAHQLHSIVGEESKAWTDMKESLEALADRLHTINHERPQRVQDLLGVAEEVKVTPPAVKVKTANHPKVTKDKKAVACSASDKSKKRSRFWRVFRAALPLQVAMVLLYCLAWLMEPQCCDFLNSMHFTFSPTLRYLKGPPPT